VLEKNTARLEEALGAFRENVAIRKKQVATDPSNTEWQHALLFSIGTISGLAYNFVLTHDFAKALEAADEAISLAPNMILGYTIRAHALMFLGREDDARALYLQ
jgi:Tfp pilus assembly protein PilF